MKCVSKKMMSLIIFSIFIVTGCRKAAVFVPSPSPPLTSVIVDLVHITSDIEDENYQSPSGETTLLWNSHGHVPILAPDGHKLTMGEFNDASGKAAVTYLHEGTKIEINLQGLIPNGIYSISILTFKLPGLHGSFGNPIGRGTLGLNGGNEHIFTAASDGTASLSAIVYAQSLSGFGSVGNCLCSEYEIQLLAAFQSGNTLNSDLGNPDSWVNQFAFQFRGHQ